MPKTTLLFTFITSKNSGTRHLRVGQLAVALEWCSADINKLLTWVLILGYFGIFCLFLPRASREVKINRKCLTCFPKQGGMRLREQQPSGAQVCWPTPSWRHLNVRVRKNSLISHQFF